MQTCPAAAAALPCRRFGGPFNALHVRVDDFRDQFPELYSGEQRLRDNVMKVPASV